MGEDQRSNFDGEFSEREGRQSQLHACLHRRLLMEFCFTHGEVVDKATLEATVDELAVSCFARAKSCIEAFESFTLLSI